MSTILEDQFVIEYQGASAARQVDDKRKVLDDAVVRAKPDGLRPGSLPRHRREVHPVAAYHADRERFTSELGSPSDARAVPPLCPVDEGQHSLAVFVNDACAGVDYVCVGKTLGEFADSTHVSGQHDVVAAEDGDSVGLRRGKRLREGGVNSSVALVALVTDPRIAETDQPLAGRTVRVCIIDDEQPPIWLGLRENAFHRKLKMVDAPPKRHHDINGHALYDGTVPTSSLASQAAFSTLGVLTQGLSRFAYSILIGRLIGVETLGTVNAALSMTLIVALLWPTGLASSSAHLLASALARGQRSRILLRRIERSFLASLIAVVVISTLVEWLGHSGQWSLLLSVAALSISYSAYILSRSMQLALGGAARVALWDTLSALCSVGGLLLVIWLGATEWVLWPMAVAFLAFSAQASVAVRVHTANGRGEFDFTARELRSMTAWNSAGLLASNGLIQLAMVAVYLGAPGSPAGYFAAAMSLATPASMLSQAVSQTLIPRLSHWQVTEPDRGRRHFFRSLATLTGTFVVVFGLAILLAEPVVRVLYGARYLPAVGSLRMLLVSMLFFSVGVIATAALIALRRERLITALAAIGLGAGVAAGVIAGVHSGWVSAAQWATLIGYLTSAACLLVAALRGFEPVFAD